MSNSGNDYFNLTTDGIAYAYRFRQVKPNRDQGKKFDPSLHVSLCALEGPTDDPNYAWFDTKICGETAQEVLQGFQEEINDKAVRVLIGFRIGGIDVQSFTYKSGQKAGQTGYGLKSRLLIVKWVKTKREGEEQYTTRYTRPEPEADNESEQPLAEAA